jgi:hypothetical protein
MINSIFDTTLIGRASHHMNLRMLVFSYILVVISFVDVSRTVSVPTTSVFLTIYKMPDIFLSYVIEVELTLSIKDSIFKKAVILCNNNSIIDTLKVATTMINTIFKCACKSSSVLVRYLSRTFKLIVLEVSSINSTILSYKMSFACLASSLN